jgi:hypothetical protein
MSVGAAKNTGNHLKEWKEMLYDMLGAADGT